MAGTAPTDFQFTVTFDAGPVHCSVWFGAGDQLKGPFRRAVHCSVWLCCWPYRRHFRSGGPPVSAGSLSTCSTRVTCAQSKASSDVQRAAHNRAQARVADQVAVAVRDVQADRHERHADEFLVNGLWCHTGLYDVPALAGARHRFRRDRDRLILRGTTFRFQTVGPSGATGWWASRGYVVGGQRRQLV